MLSALNRLTRVMAVIRLLRFAVFIFVHARLDVLACLHFSAERGHSQAIKEQLAIIVTTANAL